MGAATWKAATRPPRLRKRKTGKCGRRLAIRAQRAIQSPSVPFAAAELSRTRCSVVHSPCALSRPTDKLKQKSNGRNVEHPTRLAGNHHQSSLPEADIRSAKHFHVHGQSVDLVGHLFPERRTGRLQSVRQTARHPNARNEVSGQRSGPNEPAIAQRGTSRRQRVVLGCRQRG